MVLDNKTLKSTLIYLFLTAFLINISLHIPSFHRTSFKGDENTYWVLSLTMDWDLSNYTTSNHPTISKWGNSIYQQPVFHHGPLLPLVMKVGAIFGKPSTAALLFANFAMGALFLHLLVLYRRLSIPPAWQVLGFFSIAFAPLLLFSTTRIHLDALCGIFVACAVIAFIEALEKRSVTWSLWTGILFATALNLRYSAIISLPLIVFCQIFYLYTSQSEQVDSTSEKSVFWRKVLKFKYWKAFVIVLIIVGTLGLQHYYRLYAAYGSILPWDFMQQDPTDPWNKVLQTRTRTKGFINLILLVPLFIVFFLPQTWWKIRDGLLQKDWGATCTVFTLYLFAALFTFSYSEMRFFATATPMFYCCLPWVMAQSKTSLMPFYLCLIVISFYVMIAAGYREVIVRPDEAFKIVPVLYELIPPLQKYW